jgi:hypothetical protein
VDHTSGNGMRNIKFAENDRLLCLGNKKSENSRKNICRGKKNDTCTEKEKIIPNNEQNAADNIYKAKSYACKNCADIVRNIDSNRTNPKQRHLYQIAN